MTIINDTIVIIIEISYHATYQAMELLMEWSCK